MHCGTERCQPESLFLFMFLGGDEYASFYRGELCGTHAGTHSVTGSQEVMSWGDDYVSCGDCLFVVECLENSRCSFIVTGN